MGKTTAAEHAYFQISQRLSGSEDSCLWFKLINYESDRDLCDAIFRDEKFQAWLRGKHKLYLFLDSLDEGLLCIRKIVIILKREIEKLPCDRLYFRITCRTADWSSNLEQKLKDKWEETNVGVYQLAPLLRENVIEEANKSRINSDDFLQEVFNKNAIPLAIKPITLKFLLGIYQNGRFPSSQKDLYEEGCLQMCEEVNPDRRDSDNIGSLSAKKRLIIAGRIAALLLFSNKSAIWINPEYGDMPKTDIAIGNLCIGKEHIDQQEFSFDEKCIKKEILSITELFSSRGQHRIGFAHQTYAEFLAAWYLYHHKTPLNRIMQLFVSPEDPERKLIPQLHETSAWLASMRNDVLQEIMKTDPDVLLQSDIPTDADVRAAIVDSLLKHYEQGKLFDLNRDNYFRYGKLKHSGLTVQLSPYIQDSSKPLQARDAAIDIAEVCEVNELQEELVNVALDSSQLINLRVSAAKAICKVGNTSTKMRLKLLAVNQLPEDENDQLKGYTLRAVWPDNLTAEELFKVLTPHKRRNFMGAYRDFLDFKLAEKLQPTDLLVALNWLEKQSLRSFRHPFERLADAILLKAWQNFDFPDIAESFTKVALIQWREYQKIITSGNELQKEFESLVINDIDKRHKFIEESVIKVAQSGEDIYFLLDSLTRDILLTEDIYWMLEKLKNIDTPEERIWVELIQWKFNHQDLKQRDAILTATQTNNILREEFYKAENLRSEYQRRQEEKNIRQKPLLYPSPKEQIIIFLEQLESGNLSAWWQLNMEMMLEPDSEFYKHKFELDLTKLPGWQEADVKTRERIINAAKKYIEEYSQLASDWIETNTFYEPESAGFKALLLLLQERPETLETLSSHIWQRWASIIVGYPYNSQKEEFYKELIKWSYLKAPSETLNTLVSIIDKENKKDNPILILHKFEKCWDERFQAVLIKKARDTAIKSECLEQLLEELLNKKSTEARQFAQSLVSIPLPLEEEAHQKALVAAKVLVEYAEPISWAVLWSVIEQDTDFGREVFEAVTNRYVRGIDLNLTEKQLADLYIWLVWQYPHFEDPDHSNEVLAHNIGVRESVAELRDGVLTQLRDTGTSQACTEIERIYNQFPELTWLTRTLFHAKNIMRRENWERQSFRPEQILQIINIKESPTMKTILILASSPVDEARLRLDKEVREIDEGLRRAQKRDQFKLEQRWAVQTDDLRRALLDTEPQIVHFCGHGSGSQGLVIEDENGQSKLVSNEALANLFKLCNEHVECVLLNACYSEVQAEAIFQHIDHVIGMNNAVGDTAAIKFAMGFYDALGAGKSIETAYKFGCNAIELENIPEHLTPKLKKKQ
ncbi:CHAT domain-containing protein [Halotia branconii]|uniref:CHAT domain-containing protein n=1 Tax=Halotia branconii CENA392 TaxID=1539056 RepID=A0AAJ6P802_9CYAN|nr:CHAT domain-containing protein [Halotia branconii]WGV24180.1 CHAT domain-containing protein [Halotia branconii CENA392]